MDSQNEKNLKELFEKFMDAAQAEDFVEEIKKGDQILRDYPAPEPDDMLLANIKANIALNARPQRKINIKRITYQALSVAASIIFITAISINLFQKDTDVPEEDNIVYASLFPWEDTSADTESMYDKIEQIRAVLISESYQESIDDNRTLTEYAEVKMKLEEINSGFWENNIENINDTEEYETDREKVISDFWKGKTNEVT